MGRKRSLLWISRSLDSTNMKEERMSETSMADSETGEITFSRLESRFEEDQGIGTLLME